MIDEKSSFRKISRSVHMNKKKFILSVAKNDRSSTAVTYHQLRTISYVPSVTHHQLRTISYVPSVTYHQLRTISYVPSVTYIQTEIEAQHDFNSWECGARHSLTSRLFGGETRLFHAWNIGDADGTSSSVSDSSSWYQLLSSLSHPRR